MIIGICLAIMLVLTLFNIVLGNDWLSAPIDYTQDNNAIINGSSGSLGYDYSGAFYIDSLTGAVVILIVIIAIVGVIGIQILGSGLGENAQRVITICLSYGGIWSILSVLSYGLITSIETFGFLIYITLTLLFIVGIIQKAIANESE